MSQSDHLPTFMKTAKNRERIVKLLKQMQKNRYRSKMLGEQDV